jgi:DNA-binding transcriptional LysR family regulator
MVLVVPAHHAWANREIALDDLKSAPLLMREFGSGSRRVVEQALRDAGVNLRDCHVVMELDSTEGLLQAVEAGLGVTFVSRWAVRNQLALQTLRVARVKGLRLARQFAMVFPAGPDATGNAGDFRDLVLMAANEVPSLARVGSKRGVFGG